MTAFVHRPRFSLQSSGCLSRVSFAQCRSRYMPSCVASAAELSVSITTARHGGGIMCRIENFVLYFPEGSFLSRALERGCSPLVSINIPPVPSVPTVIPAPAVQSTEGIPAFLAVVNHPW